MDWQAQLYSYPRPD